jgi:UDP-4-amino-4,6-dideoxy-N-acetyl-beta-L-altrosamine transaminase
LIPYGKQSIDKKEIDSITKVLKSDWLTQGPKIEEFERKLANYCGSKYAVAVSNGTAALHLANLVLNKLTPSRVITTPITFLATANSIIYAGNEPLFVDIKKNTFLIDPLKIRTKLKEEKSIQGIIPVHLGGVICEMEKINKIAKNNNLWIIEDACHAFGGKWKDSSGIIRTVGDCSYSDLSTFSFHPVKTITTGEGGAITTNSKSLYDKLILLRSHGMERSLESQESKGGWFYEMNSLGYNYRMTDVQASIGIEQLLKVKNWIEKRKILVDNYDKAFAKCSYLNHQYHPMEEDKYSYHLYIIVCKKRLQLYNYLKSHKIMTQVHYIPVHLQPFYRKNYRYKSGDFPEAEAYYVEALSLPLYPDLKIEDQQRIIDLIRKFYE